MPQIGPSPLESFQIGSQLRGPSALGQFAMSLTQHILQQSQVRQEARIKGEEDIRTQKTLLPMKTAAAKELIQAKSQMQPFKSLSGEGSTKLSLATAGEKAAQNAKALLFPQGGAESFQRGLSSGASNPFIRSIGWPGVDKGQAQRVYSNLKRAYKAQLRLESGAAITDKELDDQAEQYTSNFFADKDAAFENLEALEGMLRSVRTTMDPSGMYSGMVTPSDYREPQESELMLDASGLPAGSTVMEYLD